MSTAIPVQSTDRLSMTVAFAVLVHAVIVLGVTFSSVLDAPPREPAPTLDVILVQKKSPDAPEEADFLAQADQQGGGASDDPVRPTAPLTGPALKPDPGIAPAPSPAAAPEPEPETSTKVLTTEESERVTRETEPEPEQPERDVPRADRLLQQAQEIARLEAELSRDLEAYAKRARHKYISASTREYLYASYMQAWVDKVERIGNLNYPDEARRRSLSGDLVLDVAIGPRGQVVEVAVRESSGYPVLDNAARRIVELGAPYSPLPREILEETDVLHIVRTWQFLPGARLATE